MVVHMLILHRWQLPTMYVPPFFGDERFPKLIKHLFRETFQKNTH